MWHDLSNDVTFRLVCSELRTVVSAAAALDMVDNKEKITNEIFMKAVILSLVNFMIKDLWAIFSNNNVPNRSFLLAYPKRCFRNEACIGYCVNRKRKMGDCPLFVNDTSFVYRLNVASEYFCTFKRIVLELLIWIDISQTCPRLSLSRLVRQTNAIDNHAHFVFHTWYLRTEFQDDLNNDIPCSKPSISRQKVTVLTLRRYEPPVQD